MKIATAAYPLDHFDSWSGIEDKICTWVAAGAGQGAEILVFPEYASMELAALAGAEAALGRESSLRAVAERMDDMNALHARLAQQYGVVILGGSAPVYDPAAAGNSGRPVNRAHLFAPDGSLAFQDKQIMTRFEREDWDVVSGAPLQIFDTGIAKIDVLICYDSEFPLLGRALVDAGAEVILAPSCTGALSGYWRVRIGAMARALEGQCVVVHAPLLGDAPWCYGIQSNIGAAAIYGPPDLGFPETGILAEGGLNTPGWVFAETSTAAVHRVRAGGRVFNKLHWGEQLPLINSVKTARFR